MHVILWWLDNWHWWYIATVLGMTYLKWYPWCCCDPEGPPPCNQCTDDQDTVSVTISGFGADTNCQLCANLDGTYIVRRTQFNTCSWQLDKYFACVSTYYDSLFKIRVSSSIFIPGVNSGWQVYIELSKGPSWNKESGTYRWAATGVTFDCTATRSLVYFTSEALYDYCTEWNNLTVSIN